jgi:hypothetical protein
MSDAELTVRPCRSLCAWRPARHVRSSEVRASLPLFRCRGCGSEWVRSEPWAPVDADGSVHPALAQELRLRLAEH